MKLAKWFGAVCSCGCSPWFGSCGASTKNQEMAKIKTVTIKIGTMTIDNDEQQRWDLIQRNLKKKT